MHPRLTAVARLRPLPPETDLEIDRYRSHPRQNGHAPQPADLDGFINPDPMYYPLELFSAEQQKRAAEKAEQEGRHGHAAAKRMSAALRQRGSHMTTANQLGNLTDRLEDVARAEAQGGPYAGGRGPGAGHLDGNDLHPQENEEEEMSGEDGYGGFDEEEGYVENFDDDDDGNGDDEALY